MILLNYLKRIYTKKKKLYFTVKRFLIKQNYVLRKLKSSYWKSKTHKHHP